MEGGAAFTQARAGKEEAMSNFFSDEYMRKEEDRMRHDLLYKYEDVTHYRGYTIVTLFDKTDKDWSYVIKPGTWSEAAMREPASGEDPECRCGYPTRETAIEAAKAYIDSHGLSGT